MGDLFVIDWSFIFIVVMLTVLTVGLGLRHILLRRRQKREERRATRHAVRKWLQDSNMRPLDTPDLDDAKR